MTRFNFLLAGVSKTFQLHGLLSIGPNCSSNIYGENTALMIQYPYVDDANWASVRASELPSLHKNIRTYPSMMVGKDFQTKIACYVACLTSADWENAWHSLRELGPESLRYVRQAYYDAIDDRSRELLIQVLAEKRDKESLGLFQGALHSSLSAVWKAALDSIVSVGGPAAVEILRAIESSVSKDRRRWISEALHQIE
jgi:hypothetical protein